jgi:hypothetical protein
MAKVTVVNQICETAQVCPLVLACPAPKKLFPKNSAQHPRTTKERFSSSSQGQRKFLHSHRSTPHVESLLPETFSTKTGAAPLWARPVFAPIYIYISFFSLFPTCVGPPMCVAGRFTTSIHPCRYKPSIGSTPSRWCNSKPAFSLQMANLLGFLCHTTAI